MKTIKIFLAMAAVLLAYTAGAQSTQSLTLTNRVLASGNSTNATAGVFVGSADSVGCSFAFACASNTPAQTMGNAGTVTILWQGGLFDSSYYSHPTDTNFSQTITTSSSGTVCSNMVILDTSKFMWLRVARVTNAATNTCITNLTATVWWKHN